MKGDQFATPCTICGQPCYGPTPPNWTNSYIHRDPMICSENLKIKKDRLSKLEIVNGLSSWLDLKMI